MSKFSRSVITALTASEPPLDPSILTRTSQIQLFYGAWVNMAQIAIGLAFGFASIQIPMLTRPDSPIQITIDDGSWIVSAVPLLVPIGCVISGFVMDWIGRRGTLIICKVPMIVGWLYTALAKTAGDLILARAITGVGCGMAMGPSRAYGTEIALPNMRGVIGVFPNLAVSLGITFTAALGKFFPWEVVSYICCAFAFLNFCSFFLLPETPYFVLQTKTEAEAQANLALFRGKEYNIKKEMSELKDFKKKNNLRKLSWKETMGLLLSKAACKPFTLVMIYSLIAQASGVSIILFWTTDLLKKTNSSVDLDTGNILMGGTRVVFGVFTSLLLYRFGRKPLALFSAIGVTIVSCVFGLILMTTEGPSSTPQICLMVYVVFASFGYYALPFLMAFELYPLQVRGLLGGATIFLTSILIFITTKLEPLMLDNIGVANTFILFGLFSLLGCGFIFIWLPETKDLTLQEIEEHYNDKRPTLSSQRRLESMARIREQQTTKTREQLEMLNREELASRESLFARLEAQKKLAQLVKKEIKLQLKLSTSNKDVGSTQSEPHTDNKSMNPSDIFLKYRERDRESIKSTDIKKYEDGHRESIKSTDSKKSRGITFGEHKDKKKDIETTKSIISSESKKSLLRVIYEEKQDNIDKDTPKDEKKNEDTPKDKKKDEDTAKDENKDEETPKDEKKDENTPKDKRSHLRVIYEEKQDNIDRDTPNDEKKNEGTPKDEKKDEDTPKDEDKPSTSKKNTQ